MGYIMLHEMKKKDEEDEKERRKRNKDAMEVNVKTTRNKEECVEG